MVEVLKEGMNKFLKKENTTKQLKETNKTVQNLKYENRSNKKDKLKEVWKRKFNNSRRNFRGPSFTSRIQNMEKVISGIKDMIDRRNMFKEIGILVKENIKSKNC